jgi:hypothetical protein
MNLKLVQIAIIIFGIVLISTNSFELSWAQDPESFGKGVLEDPISFFHPEERGFAFLMFIIGIAIYSLFVWYFYRYISQRDLFPRLFSVIFQHKQDENAPKVMNIVFAAVYAILFPLVIFVWFVPLAFFVFLIGEDMPFQMALFISLAIIGVVRILTYYREEAAKEVSKMIPYAILSFFLTSLAVFANPNFFTEKHVHAIPSQFIDNFEGIVAAILIITIFEFGFRIAFIIKRRFLPVSDKILEEEIETEVESIAKAHFKKMENKEKELEDKIDRLMKKLKDAEKTSS